LKPMITKDFSYWEVRCRCQTCQWKDGYGIDLDLMKKVQIIRDVYGKPMSISSGCRCPSHNKKVRGKSHSYHLPKMGCKAIDIGISVSNREGRVIVIEEALKLGLSIGINNRFLHLDNRPWNQRRIFLY
jgi:uncharacterized protein YcbK (DUF882 family)